MTKTVRMSNKDRTFVPNRPSLLEEKPEKWLGYKPFEHELGFIDIVWADVSHGFYVISDEENDFILKYKCANHVVRSSARCDESLSASM